MHDGSFSTLREVVEFYNRGGIPNPDLDPEIRPLALTPGEIRDVVSFLESLTGDNVEALVRDAFAAPVGDRP
jgi:cytochrome c peroxidase